MGTTAEWLSGWLLASTAALLVGMVPLSAWAKDAADRPRVIVAVRWVALMLVLGAAVWTAMSHGRGGNPLAIASALLLLAGLCALRTPGLPFLQGLLFAVAVTLGPGSTSVLEWWTYLQTSIVVGFLPVRWVFSRRVTGTMAARLAWAVVLCLSLRLCIQLERLSGTIALYQGLAAAVALIILWLLFIAGNVPGPRRASRLPG